MKQNFKTKSFVAIVFGLSISMLSALIFSPVSASMTLANETEEEGKPLTQEEAARLRAVIYDRSIIIGISMDANAKRPKNKIELPDEVVKLHKQKRIATIRLLLDIVKGARPKDARGAAITALALSSKTDLLLLLVFSLMI